MVEEISAEGADGGAVRFVSSHPFSATLRVERYALANGLTILVMEDHRAPVFSFQTWYRVGSKDEGEGKTGIAHLFEHLLFKESEGLASGLFDRLLELNGAETNASTWVDWTYYRESVPSGEPILPSVSPPVLVPAPKDRLELVIRLEAERMARMLLNQQQLDTEREVVRNERLYRVDNDPEGKMYETLYANAYLQHPYRWPTIGTMADLDDITVDDCVAFYRRFYAPNNATVVVVGDVDTRRLLSLLRRHHGQHASGKLIRRKNLAEPRQGQKRLKFLSRPVATPLVLFGYHIPPQNHPDHAAIEIANEILFGGRSSRMHRELVTELELATDVSGWVAPFAEPGLYEIFIRAKKGVSSDGIQTRVLAALETLTKHPPTPEEMKKAQNRLASQWVRSLETVGDRAKALGHFQTTTGDFTQLFAQRDHHRAVTPADVQRVARHYLRAEGRTVIVSTRAQTP